MLANSARPRGRDLPVQRKLDRGGAAAERLAGRIGVGLFYASKPNRARGDVSLAMSKLHLVGPAGDRVTAKGSVSLSLVAQCPLLLPSRPHAVRAMLQEACSKARLPLYVPCEIDSLLAQKEAVAMGTGYTVATYEAVAPDIAAGRLQASLIKDPPLSRVLVMTMGAKHTITTASRAVAGLISKIAMDLVKRGDWQPPDR